MSSRSVRAGGPLGTPDTESRGAVQPKAGEVGARFLCFRFFAARKEMKSPDGASPVNPLCDAKPNAA